MTLRNPKEIFSENRSADLERRRAALGITDRDDAKLELSLRAKKRKATGADFEAELDVTHKVYVFKKWGNIRRNYIPTRMVAKDKRVPDGVAHVDRTGWVRVAITPITPGGSARWNGTSRPEGTIIPVAFDAKVLDMEHSTYRHAVELQHQLHDLKAAAEAGEFAFLLVLARQVSRVFAIPILPHFTALLRDGVKLYEHHPHDHVHTFLPSIEKRDASIGWDWIPLLHCCSPGRAR